MKILYIIIFTLSAIDVSAQSVKIRCVEHKKENEEGLDSVLIQTCYYKTFKFVHTSYPDYVGRYVFSEHQVFIRSNNKYVETTNDRVFNKKQQELVFIINERIRRDFNEFKADSNSRACLTGMDSVPVYKMNDFEISFYDNEIWFSVRWGLGVVCLPVDGTIVTFKLDEIKKYLN